MGRTMILYHGINIANIKILEPKQADHDRPCVYMTTFEIVSSFYLCNAVERPYYLFPYGFRFLYKGIIINHNKKPSQPTLKRRFFKKKAAFFHGPVWERSGADFILKRKGEFF